MTAPVIHDGPTLAHLALHLLWFVQLDEQSTQGRDFLNAGRR